MALKALTIYQIGDVPLRLYAEDHHGYESDFDVETVQVARGRRLYFGDRTRTPNPRQFRLQGAVLSSNYRSLEQQIGELHAIGGGEVDIFAYSFNDCCGNANCCGDCGNTNGGDLVWLHTRGVITGIESNDKNDQGQISVSLRCSSEWKPINRIIWNHGDRRDSPKKRHTLDANIIRNLGKLPTWKSVEAMEKACRGHIFYKRRYSDNLIMYNPDVWAALHNYLRPSYLKTGYGYDWRSMEPDGAGYMMLDALYVDPSYWSAEPSSLYAFRDLTTTGSIEITVERLVANSVFDYEERTTTIDLQATSAALSESGLTGLLSTDVLVIGDLENLPGFIIRDSAIIEDFFPVVDFPDDHPGELGVRSNYITITSDVPVEIARLHTFRRI